MRKLVDPYNAELRSILEALLAEDMTVTAREVARRHSCLNDASAFTRNAARKEPIAEYAQQQADSRAAQAATKPSVSEELTEKVRERNERIAELEQTVKNLAAAHVGLIRAVQLAGGFRSLEKFWKDNNTVWETLLSEQALPGAPLGGTVSVLIRAQPLEVRSQEAATSSKPRS